ncbi:prephenate dehydrogenase (NADP(+)) [Lepraria neglecta]|uniref:Prephenate dehydrogenase [NADP(+)] n=1 Tax=Lepraria neglecta TaxID=209136 RepID=A0AAD9Z5P9_9LECA|nr:prephenate dehydrogenase (NADP(+)) [Lepraria neglecta]
MVDMDKIAVGIIGMGDMGKMYARRISAAGWRVNACDKPEKYEALTQEFAGNSKIHLYADGRLVSRSSDVILYSVEAEAIARIVSLYGPSTKQGAIVGGQTSCKEIEIDAFRKHLPEDVQIVSCHSLHGPKIDPKGQPLVLIREHASDESFALVEKILSSFGSKHVYLTAREHDRITADTQAVTHAAFLSMGTAWHANNQFPWEMNRYVGGIENVKCNIMLRIYSNKWHVYAGLAILNQWAKKQIRQYAESVTELFKLMLGGHREELEKRIRTAGEAVFGTAGEERELLLRDDVLDRYSLGNVPKKRTRNNHLSLLAMVDCWWKLGIPFRLWLGVTEYLFRKPQLLDEIIDTAIEDNTFRSDDLEFTFAARAWSECVSFGDFASYKDRFENIQKYFEPRFPEATRLGNEMIRVILAKT